MTRIKALKDLGQSVWLDYIRRDLFDGDLQKMIAQGVRGITSNPSIFEAAICKSSLYDNELTGKHIKDAVSIYEHLAIFDIKNAADQFLDVYNRNEKI